MIFFTVGTGHVLVYFIPFYFFLLFLTLNSKFKVYSKKKAQKAPNFDVLMDFQPLSLGLFSLYFQR